MTPSSLRNAVVATILLAGVARVTTAQATYRNTDIGRPLRIEDAIALDRYALDMHLAPLSFAWSRNRVRQWSVTPGATYGLLPRTQVDIAIPFTSVDDAGARRSGLAGINLGALYNFNTESATLPALAARGSILLPVGGVGPASSHPVLAAVATRSLAGLRLNLNAQYAFLAQPPGTTAAQARRTADAGVVRWLVGIAADRAFPRRSLLLGAEAYASQPLDETQRARWHVATGLRYQLTPRVTADLGVTARISGLERPWSFTFGLSRVTAIRSLRPGLGPWGGR